MPDQTTNNEQPLYQSEAFSLFPDRVEQDSFTARAVDRNRIVSNYQSPAKTNYSSLIAFKFSINGKDNEAPSGQDHQLIVSPAGGEYTSPLIVFGQKDPASFTAGSAGNLPPNTLLKIRLDMRHVLQEMEETGYYTTFSGEKIYAEDFSGVYIAGGSEPLSWDFDNLHHNPEYRLTDEDGDGIFEASLLLNPHDPDEKAEKEWVLQNDLSGYASFSSNLPLIDALYRMSLDETVMLKEDDGTFRTGAKWEGVWTRDISYSVILAYAYLDPEVSRTSLMKKVKRNRIIQDTGTGGAWPVSSDRVVWAVAAWEIYKATGDDDWLRQSYDIVKNSIEDDLATVYDQSTGLFKGESSFLDWREQTYPAWMDNVDISQSLNLGTNAVYFRTFRILAEMAEKLGKRQDASVFAGYADDLKKAINLRLWNEEKGFYNQYLYGRHFLISSPRSETLGEALTVLFDIAEPERARSVVSETPVLPFGAPSIYPQIPNIPPYHNNGIWPFVQGYWNWAAKKAGNEQALTHGLAALYRPAALFLTNKENFVAGSGDFMGTQINSDRQLWSVAANLAMVYRIYFGMEFHQDKLVFSPFVPAALAGTKELKNFKYRDATLDITIEGYGNEIASFTIDGRETEEFAVPAGLTGKRSIHISLKNQPVNGDAVNVVENKFTPPAPAVSIVDNGLTWNETEGADHYIVLRDGKQVMQTNELRIDISDTGHYQVIAVSDDGLQSFASEALDWYPPGSTKMVEVEGFAPASVERLADYSGSGFVEISKTRNKEINIPFDAPEDGLYVFSFRYSNGSGPWNTDNKCAVRTLKIDGEKAGTLVMAQRGTDEWSNWGYTNRIAAELTKGNHQLQVVWETTNENMNFEVNRAMLDHVLAVKIGPIKP